jgi:hypothetical protein
MFAGAPYLPQLSPGYRDTRLPGRLFHPEYRTSFRLWRGDAPARHGLVEISAALRAIIEDATAAAGSL